MLVYYWMTGLGASCLIRLKLYCLTLNQDENFENGLNYAHRRGPPDKFWGDINTLETVEENLQRTIYLLSYLLHGAESFLSVVVATLVRSGDARVY
jgi:hypothetical protein